MAPNPWILEINTRAWLKIQKKLNTIIKKQRPPFYLSSTTQKNSNSWLRPSAMYRPPDTLKSCTQARVRPARAKWRRDSRTAQRRASIIQIWRESTPNNRLKVELLWPLLLKVLLGITNRFTSHSRISRIPLLVQLLQVYIQVKQHVKLVNKSHKICKYKHLQEGHQLTILRSSWVKSSLKH